MTQVHADEQAETALSGLIARSIANHFGIYLGRSDHGDAYAPSERGTLVLGPPRSGKTSGIVIPNVLASAGSVLALSTKRDVLDATAQPRRRLSRCLLLDPSGTITTPTGVERVGWSPVDTASDWDRAVLTAESMVGAARYNAHQGATSHWNERAGALIATLIHGAALHGSKMSAVVRAVNRREPEILLTALTHGDAVLAVDLLSGILATDPREQSGIWSTASGVLSAYRTQAALDSDEIGGFDPNRFIAERETMFLVAPSEHQQQFAPIVAGVIRDIRATAYARSRESEGVFGRVQRDVPTLLVLDELANIAPLHDLPTLVAEGASQGVLTLACLQDLSQARLRWGPVAEGFFSLFGAKVVLGGLGDDRTLRSISLLAGEHDISQVSVTSGRGALFAPGRRSRTFAQRREPRLPPDAIAQMPMGSALALIGAEARRLELTPYFSHSPWLEASRVGRSRASPSLQQHANGRWHRTRDFGLDLGR